MAVDTRFWAEVSDDQLLAAVSETENVSFVMDVFRRLSPDPKWTKLALAQLEKGHVETRCFISWLAREIQPANYLEIGVRRGFSMVTVAARAPEAELFGFDMWVPGYAGVDNPGPRFVERELQRVSKGKKPRFISGNSHETLPNFFSGGPSGLVNRLLRREVPHPDTFDLILVDGDHSLLGAYQDLDAVMPHCALGGAVVFDDIAPSPEIVDEEAMRAELGHDPHGWVDLLGVWHVVRDEHPEFRFFEYTQDPPGVAVAVRLR